MGVTIGYARPGAPDRDPDSQTDALQAAGASMVFEDDASDAARERPGWQTCLRHLQPGDTLLVTDLSRVGRSTADLAGIIQELGSHGVGFRSLADAWLDTGSAHGPFILAMFASIAAYERARLSERMRVGQTAARAQGRRPGRPTVMTPEKSEQARTMRAQGMTLRKIAEALSVAPGTIHKELAATAANTSSST